MSRRIYNTWKERVIAQNRVRNSGMLVNAANAALQLRLRLSNFGDVDDDDEDVDCDIRFHRFMKFTYEERFHSVVYLISLYQSIEDPTIDWNSPLTRIADFNESQCIHNF